MAIIKRTRKCDGIKVYLIDFRDQHGRRVRETAGTTHGQAKDLLRQRLGEVRAGTYVRPRELERREAEAVGPTFEDFADRFQREYGDLRRSNHYAERLKPAREYLKGKRLRAIRREDLDLYAAERQRRGMGPSTIRKDLTVLGTLFKMARRWGVIQTSPADDLVKPSEPHHKTRYLSRDEWDRLSKAAPPWLRSILTLTVAGGMRLKEVVGLRWEDVDRDNGLLYVSEDNKTARPKVLPIGAAMKAVLAERGKAVDLRTGRPLSPFVFTYDEAKPYDTREARQRISRAAKRAMRTAGIEGASFHTLRHTSGSWAAQAGRSQKEIQELLGHATSRTTDSYMHLSPEHLRATIRALDEGLGMDTPVDTPPPNPSQASEAIEPNVQRQKQLGG